MSLAHLATVVFFLVGCLTAPGDERLPLTLSWSDSPDVFRLKILSQTSEMKAQPDQTSPARVDIRVSGGRIAGFGLANATASFHEGKLFEFEAQLQFRDVELSGSSLAIIRMLTLRYGEPKSKGMEWGSQVVAWEVQAPAGAVLIKASRFAEGNLMAVRYTLRDRFQKYVAARELERSKEF